MINNIYMMVAMTKKSNSIGLNGDMLYHLKEDLKYFKETTSGHTIVCGRKTYFSFPKRPLPNRKNIVLTRSKSIFDGAITMNSKEEVVKYAQNNPNEIIFIVGGDNIYKQFMDVSSKLYITEIEENEKVVADTFFPQIPDKEWKLIQKSDYITPEKAPKYRFLVYERKK